MVSWFGGDVEESSWGWGVDIGLDDLRGINGVRLVYTSSRHYNHIRGDGT